AIALIAEWNDSSGVWKGFLLGVTCGLGLLMKFSFPVYVLIPLLYFAIRGRKALLRPQTVLAFAAPAAALALPWYLFNFRPALETRGATSGLRIARSSHAEPVADIFRLIWKWPFRVGRSSVRRAQA